MKDSSTRTQPVTVERIVDKLIQKGEILPEHREVAVSELDRHLKVRTKSICRHMAMALEGAARGLLQVPN